MSNQISPKTRNGVLSRQTFVFGKANALARRIPVEKDKKHAAHIVCEGLLAMLSLCRNDGRFT